MGPFAVCWGSAPDPGIFSGRPPMSQRRLKERGPGRELPCQGSHAPWAHRRHACSCVVNRGRKGKCRGAVCRRCSRGCGRVGPKPREHRPLWRDARQEHSSVRREFFCLRFTRGSAWDSPPRVTRTCFLERLAGRRASNWLHGRFDRAGLSWPLETLKDAPHWGAKACCRRWPDRPLVHEFPSDVGDVQVLLCQCQSSVTHICRRKPFC